MEGVTREMKKQDVESRNRMYSQLQEVSDNLLLSEETHSERYKAKSSRVVRKLFGG